MNRYIVAVLIIVAIALTPCFSQTASSSLEIKNDTVKNTVVLPNPGLLKCSSGAGCSQFWLDEHAPAKAVYPKTVVIDIGGNSPYGIMAAYDKSTSISDVRAAIEVRYGKWALRNGDDVLKDLWRVESEGVTFALDTTDEGPRVFCFAIR